MIAAAAAAAEEAERVDSVPKQCTAINEDLLDALIKNLIKSAPPGTHAAHLRSLVEQHLAKIFPTVKTPHHPPYSLMIRQAITELDEEGGSTEESISEFIKLKYNAQTWGYANLLRHHLRKLRDQEEIFQVSGNRYKLSPEIDNSTGKVRKSKKRKKRGGKEEYYRQSTVSKIVSEEDEEQKGKQIQNKEQQKQEMTCGSRKELPIVKDVYEDINQMHLRSLVCNRTTDLTTEEALRQMTDAERQTQEVSYLPRQETVVWGEVNEEVRQDHNQELVIVENTSRELKGTEEQEVACVSSQLEALGSEIEKEVNLTPPKECEGMEVVTQTAEDSNCSIAAEGQILLQGKENECRKQIWEVPCTENEQIELWFECDGGVNQMRGQEFENTEKENFVAFEGENSGTIEEVAYNVSQIEEDFFPQIEGQKEESTSTERQEELKSQQFVIEGEKEARQLVKGNEEQKEANYKHYVMIKDFQNQMEVDSIQAEEELDQMEEDNLLEIAGENEETTQTNETEDQHEVNCEKQYAPSENHGATGFSEEQNQEKDGAQYLSVAEQFDGKVPATEQQEKPMEMKGPAGVSEGQNVKEAGTLMEEQFDGNLQSAVIAKDQVKAIVLQKHQLWQPEVNEQHIKLKEMGAEMVEWIEKIITPQRSPEAVGGNKREGDTRGHTANSISYPAFPSLKQEQCLELLNTAVKMQGLIMDIMKSSRIAESSICTSDVAMLESNAAGVSDDQLPNATAETAPPSCQDMVMAEPREDVEISCSASLEGKAAEVPLNLDMVVSEPPEENVIFNSSMPSLVEETSMLASDSQSKEEHPTASESEKQQDASSAFTVLKDLEEQLQHQEVAVVLEPREQIEQLCNDSTVTTPRHEEIMVMNHQEKQAETHSMQGSFALQSEAPEVDSIVVVKEATKKPLIHTLDNMSHFSPEQEALKNNKPTAEGHVENSFQLKLPDLQSSNYFNIQEISGPPFSAEPMLLSFAEASQGQLQKVTDFVNQNQLLHQQTAEVPTRMQLNTEPSFRQHLQSDSQLVNPVKITENNDVFGMPQHRQHLQPNVLQGCPRPPPPSFGGYANTDIFRMPQQQQWHGQQNETLSPLMNQNQDQLPFIFDNGSLFQQSLLQQPEEPLNVSLIKPSSLSGGKLQPLKPIELRKLMEEPVNPSPRFSPAKQMWPPQQRPGSSVGASEQVPQKKRRGRPPKQPAPPGYTPPRQRRPKIKQTVPKKLPSAAVDGYEGPSSQSPSKQGPGRPPKRMKVAATVEEPIVPRNPF